MSDQVCHIDDLEKILLSTDGSEYSSGAVREAINLAGRCSSQLIAMSVIETNVEFSALAPELVEKEELKTRKILEEVKAQAEEAGVPCEIVAHEGETPWRFIVDEAEKRDVGMIVMGRRGRSAVKKIVVGSVTARVIGHSNRPVMVTPRASHLTGSSVLLATDGSEYSMAAADYAIDYGKKFGIKPVVVSVASNSSELSKAEENIAKVAETAKGYGVEVEGVTMVAKPQEAIVGTAKERDIELIVIGSHGRTGLERLLMGSVAEGVIDSTECAVLVVKS